MHRTKWGQAFQHRIVGRDFQKMKQAEIIKPEKVDKVGEVSGRK